MAPPIPSRRGRKRKQVAHYSDDNPSTFTTKVKHGVASNSLSPDKKKRASPKSDAETTSTRVVASRKRPWEEEEEQQQDDDAIVCHSHDMRLHPILPENLIPHESKNDGHVVFGKGLGRPRPLAKPEWQMVSTPHMVTDAILKNKKLPPPRLLCMDISQDETYMVVGNSLGQVLVYSLTPLVIHVGTLQTSASRRPQEPPSFKFKKKNEANAIHCVSMSTCDRVVVSSLQEVECFDTQNQSLLWSFSIDSASVSVTKLNVHATNFKVLVSVVYNNVPPSNESPLWLLDGNNNANDEQISVKKDVLPHNILRCASMWDRSNPDRFLVVTTNQNDEEPQELLLMDATTNDILHRAQLALSKTSKSIESLSQSPQGMYTIVASSKGIRLFLTDSLQLVHVYGEGLALHSHGVAYQQACLFAPSPDKDESRYQEGNVLIVGVPHSHREPRELQDQLQIWQWWDSKQPCLTLPGPPRSLGLAHVWTLSTNYILVLTHAGDVWMLSPTATTDWPGVMYPPGYHTIDDNLVYIEDEDELDVVVEEAKSDDEREETLDDELAEALRQSILEAQAASKEENVEVALSRDETPSIAIPCHPDPALKAIVEKNTTVSSPKRRGTTDEEMPACFLRQVLGVMPTRERATRGQSRVKVLEATADAASTAKPTRGKRSRAGNLEAMIRASINPDLQKFMTSKEKWANGSGSTLRDFDKVSLEMANQIASAAIAKEEIIAGNVVVAASAAMTENSQGEVGQSNVFVSEKSVDSGKVVGHGAMEDGVKQSAQEAVTARPMDDAATSALEGMLALQQSLSGSEDTSPRKSEVPPVPPFESVSSAAAAENVTTNDAAASDRNATGEAHKGLNGALSTGVDEQRPASVTEHDSVSSNTEAEVTVEDTSSVKPATVEKGTKGGLSENVDHVVPQVPQVTIGDVASASIAGEQVSTNEASPTANASIPAQTFCSACRGRMTLHTCGKRDVPVDTEAIERAEQERLEREAEEKKKQRAEKRRQADARRREAKKKKKLEEERQRREEEERRRVEEEQRRAQEEEMERARREAEERLLGDHAERDKRRAEMWQRLIAANGGNQQDDGYNAPTDHVAQVETLEAQPLHPTPSVDQRVPVEVNHATYGEQQSYFQPSYEQAVVGQDTYGSVQEQQVSSAGDQAVSISVAVSSPYNRTSPMPAQESAPQTLSFSSPSAQQIGGRVAEGQPFHETYQGEQSAPSTLESQVMADGTEQSQTTPSEHSQFGYGSNTDSQTPSRGLLERRNSAQLGTAEALASLANMCVQMPRAPTPKQSPHGSVTEHTEGPQLDSYSQSTTAAVNPSQSLEAAMYETVRNDDAASNTGPISAEVMQSSTTMAAPSQPTVLATMDVPTQPTASTNTPPPYGSGDSQSPTQTSGTFPTASAEAVPKDPLAMLAEQSENMASRLVESVEVMGSSTKSQDESVHATAEVTQDVSQSIAYQEGGPSTVIHNTADSSVVSSSHELNGHGSHVEESNPPFSHEAAPAKVTPIFSQPAAMNDGPALSITESISVEGSNQTTGPAQTEILSETRTADDSGGAENE